MAERERDMAERERDMAEREHDGEEREAMCEVAPHSRPLQTPGVD